jgi:hypothetical protein
LAKRVRRIHPRKTICIVHDIERDLGHLTENPEFARTIRQPATEALDAMLEIEKTAGVKATYSIVGMLWDDVAPKVTAAGHSRAFHSFDHRAEEEESESQIARCQRVDYRVKGYRPPKSRITEGLSDPNLAYYNIEWLASSAYSMGRRKPWMENSVVKIPMHFDDFDLYRGLLTFEEWEQRLFEIVEELDIAVIDLHDCYFEHWLPHYPRLLDRLRSFGEFKTLDQVAAEITLRHARWS